MIELNERDALLGADEQIIARRWDALLSRGLDKARAKAVLLSEHPAYGPVIDWLAK